MSTPSVRYPMPTSEERSLQAAQLASIQRSEEQQKMWDPILQEELGYREIVDPETGAKSLQQIPEEEFYASLSEPEKQAYDIQKLASERELKALRGELEIDPAVERDIREQNQQLAERMTRQVGTGWESSTPGIEALSKQKETEAIVRDAVRRGEMTSTEALAQSRSGQLQRLQEQVLRGSGTGQARALDVAGAYEQPKSWLSNLRQQQFQSKLAKAQLQAQKMGQMSSSFSGGCCWTFIEAEGGIPEEVRRYRDEKHSKSSNVALGYGWMSSWLVPLMKKKSWVKKLTKALITQPMTKYAQWYYGKNRYGWMFYPSSLLIGTLWNIAGWMIKPLFTDKELLYAISARSRAAYQN